MDQKIKVLFVNQSSNHGGAEIIIAEIFNKITSIEKYIIGSNYFVNDVLNNTNNNIYYSQYIGNVKQI